MKGSDWTNGAIIIETITAICAVVYLGLQVFCTVYYGLPVIKPLLNIAILALVYLGMTLLLAHPEKICQIPPQLCKGKVRKDCLWMIRLIRLIFVASLLIPGVADAMAVKIRTAYSAIVIFTILGIAFFFLHRIYNDLRQ